MRLSVRSTDDCCDTGLCSWVTPYLDGVKQDECVMADEDAGFCIVNSTDKDGKIMLDPTQKFVMTDKLFGDVVIMWCVP